MDKISDDKIVIQNLKRITHGNKKNSFNWNVV